MIISYEFDKSIIYGEYVKCALDKMFGHVFVIRVIKVIGLAQIGSSSRIASVGDELIINPFFAKILSNDEVRKLFSDEL